MTAAPLISFVRWQEPSRTYPLPQSLIVWASARPKVIHGQQRALVFCVTIIRLQSIAKESGRSVMN